MSTERIAQELLLPDLRYVKEIHYKADKTRVLYCEKVSEFEVCPKCASKCSKVYDRVEVTIKDAPIRNKHTILKIRKRRFKCQNCKYLFREPVGGIFKGFRTTQRFRLHLRWCASNFCDLKRVTMKLRCSTWLVYKAFYEQIELELRKTKNPWPKTIGIDEHSFIRNAKGSRRDFVSIFVDYNNKRVKDLVLGKSIWDLKNSSIAEIPGRENVKNVVLDLSPTFRSFAKDFFPNAKLVADKFHVVKLMHPLIHELRKEVIEKEKLVGKRTNPIIRLLLRYRNKLEYYQKRVIDSFLELSPALKEVYWFQQRLYRFYRIKGLNQARAALISLLDDMARSKIKEVVSYRNTFRSWHQEILNYFSTKLTNGRTEGYNRKAKLIQPCAYGFRSFKNYRLKLLYSCR